MLTIQNPGIYFTYVAAVAKYLDLPSTGFHSNTVQCNKHTARSTPPIPLLYSFTTSRQGIGTRFLCSLLHLATADKGSTPTFHIII